MKTETIALSRLLLDPNNYRLRTHPEYRHVDKKAEVKSAIQKRTYNLIVGEKNFEILELIESIKANGFLRVDQILVRKSLASSKNDKKYIVIEGNRRIAALKYLEDQYKNGYDIGKLTPSIFDEDKGIDVVIYDYKNVVDYLVLMGLKHVSGNKKWETYNQAKLLFELKTKGFTSLDIAQKIGIEKSDVERLLRGYFAIEDFIREAKSENMTEYFNPHDKFMIFVELTNKPHLKKWIGWDEKNYKITNEENKLRFFHWVMPRKDYDEDTDEKETLEPIIISHKQVRVLDDVINDEETISTMEEYGDFSLAISESSTYSQQKFAKSLKNIEKALNNFSIGYISNLGAEDINTLKRIKKVVEIFLNKSPKK